MSLWAAGGVRERREHRHAATEQPARSSTNKPTGPAQAVLGLQRSAGLAEAVLGLQRSAGNRAISQAVAVQRTPLKDLSQQTEVDSYSGDLVRFWKTHPTAPLGDLLNLAEGEVTLLLDENGIPATKITSGTPRTALANAELQPEEWQIVLNLKALPKSVRTLADLKLADLTALATTLYHEARHAEQRFLAARELAQTAGGKINADKLAAQMAIPSWVAKEAIAAARVKLPAGLARQAHSWRGFMGSDGRFMNYKAWNDAVRDKLSPYALDAGDALTLLEKMDAPEVRYWVVVEMMRDTSSRWYVQPFRDLDTRAQAVEDEILAHRDLSPDDAAVLRSFSDTSSTLRAAVELQKSKLLELEALRTGANWDRPAKPDWVRLPADVKATLNDKAQGAGLTVHIAFHEAWSKAFDAYKAYFTEADAFATEAKVKGTITRLSTP